MSSVTGQPEPGGSYVLNRDEAAVARMQARQLPDQGFFTRHLHRGMRLLDVGCGPGSITLDLAALIAPGDVIGIDIDDAMLDKAREAARERDEEKQRVRFEAADAYSLPYPDASFDAAWSHFVFVHLDDPHGAMREVRRVLRPGGVFCLMDTDLGFFLLEPETELARQLKDLLVRVQEFNGGDFLRSRKYRRMLLDAGFSRAEAGTIFHTYGDTDSTRQVAPLWRTFIRANLRTALEQGWIDDLTYERLLEDVLAWGERPDAFATNGSVIAVGFV